MDGFIPSGWNLDQGSPSNSDDTARDNAIGSGGKIDANIDYSVVLQMLKPNPHKVVSPSPPASPSPEETAAAVADAMADAASKLPLDLTLNPNFPTLFGASMAPEESVVGEASSSSRRLLPDAARRESEATSNAHLLLLDTNDTCETNSSILGNSQHLYERQRKSEERIASLEGLLLHSGVSHVGREELQAVQSELKKLSVRLSNLPLTASSTHYIHP